MMRGGRQTVVVLAIIVGGAILHRSYAAAPVREEFPTGPAGWTATGSLTIAANGGVLEGSFSLQNFPFPESGAFRAAAGASGGSFTGNYTAAGIQLVGFPFMALDVLPSAAMVRWSSPTSSFFRSFTLPLTQTGVWYHLAFSLDLRDAGKWAGGDRDAFAAALQNVQFLEIHLTRSGMSAQRYRLDNVFLGARPVADSITADGRVVWTRLQPQTTYRVLAADSPGGNWETGGVFTAGSDSQTWRDVAATNYLRRYYRLAAPETP